MDYLLILNAQELFDNSLFAVPERALRQSNAKRLYTDENRTELGEIKEQYSKLI